MWSGDWNARSLLQQMSNTSPIQTVVYPIFNVRKFQSYRIAIPDHVFRRGGRDARLKPPYIKGL
ncbi:MAG: hypothetical protein JETT_2718 [Candidatus Jettenia ecosi]|uniref:Uncharacterized protein n=1 Tax=Candidatus Jettenia ecosi TaxID=2494326 RepID=A0A533QKE0_9BACT|nr:MAG: hypothetical protein JETT_2718 [Candidatus Jettenia ecosi]